MTNCSAPLGVAVVGYSFMGKAHSNAWRNVAAFYPDAPAITQRVLVGRNEPAVQAAASRYGWAEASTDWRSILRRDDIDLVDICTPGHLHAEIAQAALAAGKHVLVEKPLANDLIEAEAMVAAAENARRDGVLAMVGFNYRRVPALALASRLVAEGRIGTVRQARVSYLQDWLTDGDAAMSWRLRRECAGSGVIGDLGSHAVDQIGFLLGDTIERISGSLRTFVPERPTADGTLEPVTVEDAAWATLHTSRGVVISLEVSRMAAGRKNAFQIELYGSEGSLRFDLERLNELQVYDGRARPNGILTAGFADVLVTEADHPYLSAWWPPGHTLGWDHTFVNQAADFLSTIAAGGQPTPSFDDGIAVQRVLAALESSAALGGREVKVHQNAAPPSPGGLR